MITATLNEYANSLGMDPDTIRRAMSKAGMEPAKPGEKIPLGTIINKALYPPLEDPKQRLLLAQAIEQEKLNAEADGRLVEWDRVEALFNQRVVMPSIALLDTCKDLEFVNSFRAILRQKLEAPKP